MISRIKKALTAIPASIIEATTYLISIGEKQRAINLAKHAAKKKIETITIDVKKEVEKLTKERDAFFVALFAFAAPRKVELTKKARSIKTDKGVFGWRWTTPAVDIQEGKTDEDIIALLQKKGLTKYVRVLYEIDREALLRDEPEVTGVTYTQRDEFFAKPKLAREEGRAEELVRTETETIDI